MGKTICEICGTTYQDTADSCPICGWAQNTKLADEDLDLDGIRKDLLEEPEAAEESTVPQENQEKKNRAIFDYDAVNTAGKKPIRVVQKEETSDEGEEEEEEEESHTNVFLVVFLVILIVALLLTTGYMFMRFFKPTKKPVEKPEVPAATAQIVETVPEETDAAVVPCVNLALPGGIDVLKAPGQSWMLHAVVLPEDTTDEIVYVSENEEVATVDEAGTVTAVGEGATNIVVTCGSQKISCPITVRYEEETQPVTEAPTETAPAAKEDGGETAKQPTKSDVVIKLKKSDIQLGRMGVYYDLELDCDLDPEDVEWITSNSFVATVNNGRVTVTGRGVATVTAKYGGREATCIVRCKLD